MKDLSKYIPFAKKACEFFTASPDNYHVVQNNVDKLKAAGYDLKSPEGAKMQQRLLKVLRRFLKKDLERLGLSSKVKLLAMFSKSKPKKGKVNESMHSLEESYLDFFSNYMLEGIINELQNQ